MATMAVSPRGLAISRLGTREAHPRAKVGKSPWVAYPTCVRIFR